MTTTGQALTASDPEPPPGTLVRDDCGQKWIRYREGAVAWEPWEGGDSESWTKIAGNYGPVTVIEWGDDATVPADTPIPGVMYPPEKCPHCDGYQHTNRMDEHIATTHADLPPCTAALDNEHTNELLHCVLRVPHRLGEYGDFHVSARGPIGRTIWNDSADGARPHREEADA